MEGKRKREGVGRKVWQSVISKEEKSGKCNVARKKKEGVGAWRGVLIRLEEGRTCSIDYARSLYYATTALHCLRAGGKDIGRRETRCLC